ncbi:Sensor histidine kinase GraS [compost metagenome]
MLEEEKDDLLSWVHEVKTPLTAMHLMIERLDDETIKTQLTYEWLRIHLLLDQQLHQKRIVFIENDLYVEQVQLKPLISQEIRTLRSWCMQKGIGFDVDLQVTEVLSDAKWLAFIVRQLITNAVKYSEAADVYVRSYSQDDGAILEVQDSGRGIDQRDLHRIFDKGFTSTLNHHEHMATGMGLYLSKKAADSLMIQIDVQSKPGQGTTMRLIFPKRNDFVLIRES